jgi:glycosyltransferase involved in cell wall biosynthesis
LLRKCARKSDITFATTTEALQRVIKLGAKRVELLPQVFFSKERLAHFSVLTAPNQKLPLRILSIGRNLYWKGFQYGLEAAALLKQRKIPFIYTIVGQGPFAQQLHKQVSALGLSDSVAFVPRIEGDISVALQNCHVLLHPALHETFGNVCLEALAAGRPVICLNVGGPATQVTSECGLAAPTGSPRQAVLLIADKLTAIALEPDLWKKMSRAAIMRAQSDFSLEKVKRKVLQAYADLQ